MTVNPVPMSHRRQRRLCDIGGEGENVTAYPVPVSHFAAKPRNVDVAVRGLDDICYCAGL